MRESGNSRDRSGLPQKDLVSRRRCGGDRRPLPTRTPLLGLIHEWVAQADKKGFDQAD